MDNILQGLQNGNLYRSSDNYARKRDPKRSNGKFRNIIT